MDQLELVIISAILNAICAAIGLYIGFTKGSSKTVDIILDRLQKRLEKSPAAQKLLNAIQTTDKLFGDDQAIEQITRFFREASNLVSSPEAKNFFKTLTALMTAKPPPIKKVKKLKQPNQS
jgi:enoyl reductase-like protein